MDNGAHTTVGAILADAATQLHTAGVPEAQLDAEWLLSHCLDQPRLHLAIMGGEPVSSATATTYAHAIARRARREPLQHILESQAFFGRLFRVTPAVLIPRPETEQLVARVLQQLPAQPQRILDVGTGSGCIAITLALERPDDTIVATELSADALAIAHDNASRQGVSDRITWLHTDLAPNALDTFDCLVSNPPYVPLADHARVAPEVRDYEPRDALCAGADGMDILQRILCGAREWVRPGGLIALEFGDGQRPALAAYAAQSPHLTLPHFYRDLQGKDRMMVLRRGERTHG
jgi:release factor glutamine methyltransferase